MPWKQKAPRRNGAGPVVAAGQTVVAALDESGISTEHHAMSGLYPAKALLRPAGIERRLLTSRRLHQRLAALTGDPPAGREYTQAELHEQVLNRSRSPTSVQPAAGLPLAEKLPRSAKNVWDGFHRL